MRLCVRVGVGAGGIVLRDEPRCLRLGGPREQQHAQLRLFVVFPEIR